jgi:hypothetical protein
MTPEDIIPKLLLVTNLALVLAQNLPSFSKSLVPSACQLQNTSSSPKQTLASSIYTHQGGATHFKTSLEISASAVSPPAFLLCTLAVNIPDNLDPYLDYDPLIIPDIHYTNHLEKILFLHFMLHA